MFSSNRLRFAVSIALLASGCGSSPEAERAKYHKELARYTPEILAVELINRFTALKSSGSDATAKEKAGADKQGEGGKSAEGGKKNPFSPDAVLEDVADKAKKIEGKTPSQVFDEVMAIVDKSNLDESTRGTVRSKLKSAMKL